MAEVRLHLPTKGNFQVEYMYLIAFDNDEKNSSGFIIPRGFTINLNLNLNTYSNKD